MLLGNRILKVMNWTHICLSCASRNPRNHFALIKWTVSFTGAPTEREIGIIYYDNQQTLDFKTDYGYLDPRYISSELLQKVYVSFGKYRIWLFDCGLRSGRGRHERIIYLIISSYRSFQSGFIFSISSSFQRLFHFFICFSLLIAPSMLPHCS